VTSPPEGTISVPIRRKRARVNWWDTIPYPETLGVDFTGLAQSGPLAPYHEPSPLAKYPLAGTLSGTLIGSAAVTGAPEALLGAGGDVLRRIEEAPRRTRTRIEFPRDDEGRMTSFVPSKIGEVPIFEGKMKRGSREIAGAGRFLLSSMRDSALFKDIREWRAKWGKEIPTRLAGEYPGIDEPFSWKWFLYHGPEATATMGTIIGPALAAGAVGGPTAAAVVGGTIAGAMEAGLSYDDYRFKLMEKGYSKNEAEEIAGSGAIGYGVAAGVVEVFPLMKIFGKAPGLRARFMRALSSAVAEGSEESIQDFLDRITQVLSGVDEEALEKMTPSEFLQSFTLGAMPGFAFGVSTPSSLEAKMEKAKGRLEELENIIHEKAIDEAKARNEIGAVKEMVREILTAPSKALQNKKLLRELADARQRIAKADREIKKRERGARVLGTKPREGGLTKKESKALRQQTKERQKEALEAQVEEEVIESVEEERPPVKLTMVEAMEGKTIEEKKLEKAPPKPVRVVRPTAPAPPTEAKAKGVGPKKSLINELRLEEVFLRNGRPAVVKELEFTEDGRLGSITISQEGQRTKLTGREMQREYVLGESLFREMAEWERARQSKEIKFPPIMIEIAKAALTPPTTAGKIGPDVAPKGSRINDLGVGDFVYYADTSAKVASIARDKSGRVTEAKVVPIGDPSPPYTVTGGQLHRIVEDRVLSLVKECPSCKLRLESEAKPPEPSLSESSKLSPELATKGEAFYKKLLSTLPIKAYPAKPWTGSGKAETEGELRAEFKEVFRAPEADLFFDWLLSTERARLPRKAGRPKSSIQRKTIKTPIEELEQQATKVRSSLGTEFAQEGLADSFAPRPSKAEKAVTDEGGIDLAGKEEALRALNRAMADLPQDQRRVLQLKYTTRMDNDQIAAELEIPVEDIEVLEQEGLQALRDKIVEAVDPETAEDLREALNRKIERRGIIYVGWVEDIARELKTAYLTAQMGFYPAFDSLKFLGQKYGLRGATFIEQFGESGQRLAKDIREIDFDSHKAARNDIEDLKKVLRDFTAKQREFIMQLVNSRLETIEYLNDTASDELLARMRKAADQTREILDRVLQAWINVGGQRRVGKKLLTPIFTGMAFPQVLNVEGRRILDQFRENPSGATPDLITVAEHLVKTGQAKTRQAAMSKLAAFNRARLRGVNPYLEQTRVELPLEMVEWNPNNVLPNTIEGAWKFVEAVRRWGYARTTFPKMASYLSDIQIKHSAGDDAVKVIRPFLMAEFGRPETTPRREMDVLMAVNKWETITKLGLSPLSVLRNGLDRYSKGFAVASFWTNVQATLKYPPIINQWFKSGRKIQEQVIRAGAQWSLTHLSEGAEGAGKLTHFTMAMFKAAERGNQSYLALLKSMQVQKDLATLGKIEASGKVHNRIRSLLSLGWKSRDELYRRLESSWVTERSTQDILFRATSSPGLSQNDLDSIMHRAVRDLAFPVSLSTKRIWWNDNPWFRLAFKFKTWGSDQVGHIYKDVYKRALHGNIAPLIRFVGAMIFVGEIYNLLRDLLFGKEESITMSMLKRPDRRNPRDIAARCMYNFFDGGGVGIVADLTYGVTEFIVGPVGSTFENFASFGVHTANRPSQIHKAAFESLKQEFVATRQFEAAISTIDKSLDPERNQVQNYTRWRERVFDWREKNGKGTEGRVDAFVTNVLTGFKSEHEVSANTLTFDLAARQITLGDVDDASNHLAALIKNKKGKERVDIIERIEASMRQRSPLGRLAEEDEAAFMKGFTPEQRREALRFDNLWKSRYQKALGMAIRKAWSSKKAP